MKKSIKKTMIIRTFSLVIVLLNAGLSFSQVTAIGKETIGSCRARLENDILTIENNLIRRCYKWNNGNLMSQSLEDKSNGQVWNLRGKKPDCSFPGTTTKATVLDRLCLPGRHWRLKAVRFINVTDRHNTLVQESSALVFSRKEQYMIGNTRNKSVSASQAATI